MSINKESHHTLQGLSKLAVNDRLQRLVDLGIVTLQDIQYLQNGGIQDLSLANQLIENSIGYFQLPLGVATNFRIDGRDYVIPLAVEETSIIAALSKTAKWIKAQGEICTWVSGNCIVGQIQIAKVSNLTRLVTILHAHKESLLEQANQQVAFKMVQRGGGVKDLQIRHITRPDGGTMVVIHISMNTCDAMGANIINQVLEFLKNPIEQLTGEQVTMCILSNLNHDKLTTATVTVRNVEKELGERLEEASLFAELDPYRAATHNKGVMNGIDPVLIATGNDWRAVEAGIHAYATSTGQYKAITCWRYKDGILTGQLTAPIIVGTVGGVTTLHPTAKLCLEMMRVRSANDLSRLLAAVGLVQNLGALRALCTEGITQGHMKLHINNLLMFVGASASEMPVLKEKLQHWLFSNKRVSLNNASELLAEIRQAGLI